jgi:hypothetical protein
MKSRTVPGMLAGSSAAELDRGAALEVDRDRRGR